MHWLARTSTQPSSNASSYAASKPVRISEPKPVRSIDILSPPRIGTLGSGAMVVRTPDEALRETGVRLTHEPPGNKEEYPVKPVDDGVTSTPAEQSHTPSGEPLSPPTSPPLPPLPLPDTAEEKILAPESPKLPLRPTRATPPTPPSRRSSLKARLVQVSQDPPAVPEVPPHFAASAQPPPFSAILISDPPSVKVDPSMAIVTLETCTTTYRTTVNTVKSRRSHLSDFISSLCDQCEPKSSVSSVYSISSEDMTAYHHHLTSQGLFPRSTNIHIFLDRPSAPYKHILNYLRSPPSPYHPDILPHSLQFLTQSTSSESQLEKLIEVRDEAAFLNLDSLHKLCVDEIRLRYGPKFHTRDNSASSRLSIQSLQASVHSLHTVLERVETDLRNNVLPYSSDISHPSPQEAVGRSPPTPQSWDGPLIQQTQQSRQGLKSPPAGWI
ncbi:hypothetical protein BYT27DRAFT_7133201 [Phlegmacium glaucopus]|nr:hypothetical protein BYT27DRAFT_7133201 [Phlegmacium glaucopus]